MTFSTRQPLKIINSFRLAASPLNMSVEDKMEVDGRSVFVGNVSTYSYAFYSVMLRSIELTIYT